MRKKKIILTYIGTNAGIVKSSETHWKCFRNLLSTTHWKCFRNLLSTTSIRKYSECCHVSMTSLVYVTFPSNAFNKKIRVWKVGTFKLRKPGMFPTRRLETRFIIILSGKSMVLAMASTMSRACRRVGHSNRLYNTCCLRVHNRSN